MASSPYSDPVAAAERRRAEAARRQVREVAQLKSQNAQLKVDSRRYQLLQRSQRNAPVEKPAAAAPVPYTPVDPRRVPVAGTKVMAALSPPLALGIKMGAAIGHELRAMAIEVRSLIRQLEAAPNASALLVQAQAALRAQGATGPYRLAATSTVRAALDAAPGGHDFELLRARWNARFEKLARIWARRLVTDVTATSTAQMAHGLKDVASMYEIESTLQSPRMRTLVEAATEASVGLITRIPQRFLSDVQAKVMRAITVGSGLNELVPYLTKRYKGDARHAHLVALDQIRKVSESVNEARLTSLGVEEYVWIATGGERYPRKLHHEHLNGKTFRYDDPPVIEERTGERGKPGDAINCRCRARPVLNFLKMREK